MKYLSDYVCLKKTMFMYGDYAIRTISPDDISDIMNWRNLQLNVLRQKKELTFDEQKNYFEKVIWPSLEQKEPRQILMSFFCNDRLIGYGGLVHISWEDKRGELSFLSNPDRHTNEQYNADFTHFIKLIKSLAFSDLLFNRIYTETYSIRERHISILENNGFVFEGLMKSHVFIDGVFVDSLIHGCLKINQ